MLTTQKRSPLKEVLASQLVLIIVPIALLKCSNSILKGTCLWTDTAWASARTLRQACTLQDSPQVWLAMRIKCAVDRTEAWAMIPHYIGRVVKNLSLRSNSKTTRKYTVSVASRSELIHSTIQTDHLLSLKRCQSDRHWARCERKSQALKIVKNISTRITGITWPVYSRQQTKMLSSAEIFCNSLMMALLHRSSCTSTFSSEESKSSWRTIWIAGI